MTSPGPERTPPAVRLAVAGLLTIFSILAIASARRTSATWDEPRYLGLGRYIVETGRFDLPSITTTPPLTFYLNSLLLPFVSLDRACFVKGPEQDIVAGVRRGQCLLRQSEPRGDDLLFLSRLPFIGVGVLLGLLIFHWSRRLHGDAGGLLSLALYVTCPNILASTRLINQDITLSLLGLATVYACWRWRDRGWRWRDAMTVGVLLGLALAAKYPGLLFVPMVVGLWAIRFLSPSESARARPTGGRGGTSLLQLAALLAMATIVLALTYGLRPGTYRLGFQAQSLVVGGAFPAFMNGEVSHAGGFWSYYLEAAAIKTPLPALALYLLGAAVLLTRRSGDRWLPLFLLAPALTIVAAMSSYRTVNVGLRYILPAYPFLMVAAGGLARAVSGRGRVAVLGLVAWCGLETARIHPHYLAYFNQTVGGPSQGYRYLQDGNLGWGGDLKELAEFAKRNRIPKLKLSYHGTALPELYGLDYEPLPSFMLPKAASGPVRLAEGDWVAVSAENLEPLFIDMGELRRFLKAQRPDAVIGHSIFVYHLTDLQGRLRAFAETEAGRGPGNAPR